jgi:hypothetical protein
VLSVVDAEVPPPGPGEVTIEGCRLARKLTGVAVTLSGVPHLKETLVLMERPWDVSHFTLDVLPAACRLAIEFAAKISARRSVLPGRARRYPDRGGSADSRR